MSDRDEQNEKQQQQEKQKQKQFEKQTENGAGHIRHEFRQNHKTTNTSTATTTTMTTTSTTSSTTNLGSSYPSNQYGGVLINPNELTAEWTVRAQLKFARAGEKFEREFHSNDPINPVRVVYKWSTLDSTSGTGTTTTTATNSTGTTTTGKKSATSSTTTMNLDHDDVEDIDIETISAPITTTTTTTTPISIYSSKNNYRQQQQKQQYQQQQQQHYEQQGSFQQFDQFQQQQQNQNHLQQQYDKLQQQQQNRSYEDDNQKFTTTTSNPSLHSFKTKTTYRPTTTTATTSAKQQQKQESFHSSKSSINLDPINGGGVGGAGVHVKGSESYTTNTSKSPLTLISMNRNDGGTGGLGEATATFYGTRCRSTCNIIVSAVADFLPAEALTSLRLQEQDNEPENEMTTRSTNSFITRTYSPHEEPDPFVFNTTASYTVLPEKAYDEFSKSSQTSKNFSSFGKILNLKDAFSQTSDTETKYFQEQKEKLFNAKESVTGGGGFRRTYDNRRATTEAIFQSKASTKDDEGSNFLPSYMPSLNQTFKSASLPRIPPFPGQQYSSKAPAAPVEAAKKPRTVHIDVYCTGSEDENADVESSSSDSDMDDTKHYEIDSNSTPQTVLDNEQMLLRHQRVTGKALPRRLNQQQQQHSQHSQHPQQKQKTEEVVDQGPQESGVLNLGHGLTKSSTAEEVSESKQLLFRKHIGDQRAAKLANLRQKYLRQSSEDALSSNYPNSSRSTVRDATCSSISSVVAAGDFADSSWKETEDNDESSYNLAKSESFDYENSLDRLRIRQMENIWSRNPQTPERFSQQITSPIFFHPHGTHSILQTISEDSSQRNSPFTAKTMQRNDTLPSDMENFSENDQFHTYPGRNFQQTSHFFKNKPNFLQFFGPPSPSPNPPSPSPPVVEAESHFFSPETYSKASTSTSSRELLYPTYESHLPRWSHEPKEPKKEDERCFLRPEGFVETFQRGSSEAPPTTTSAETFNLPSLSSTLVQNFPRRFDLKRESPVTGEASTGISGYTPEYLEKARKFGKVVAAKKPGHHIGPTKNPNCSCDSCQRWLTERFQLRSRAFSLGERPSLKRVS